MGAAPATAVAQAQHEREQPDATMRTVRDALAEAREAHRLLLAACDRVAQAAPREPVDAAQRRLFDIARLLGKAGTSVHSVAWDLDRLDQILSKQRAEGDR
jgi:hypothetical protein